MKTEVLHADISVDDGAGADTQRDSNGHAAAREDRQRRTSPGSRERSKSRDNRRDDRRERDRERRDDDSRDRHGEDRRERDRDIKRDQDRGRDKGKMAEHDAEGGDGKRRRRDSPERCASAASCLLTRHAQAGQKEGWYSALSRDH